MPQGTSCCRRAQQACLRNSVVNVSRLLTLDGSFLTEQAGTLPPHLYRSVDEGLRMVLQL